MLGHLSLMSVFIIDPVLRHSVVHRWEGGCLPLKRLFPHIPNVSIIAGIPPCHVSSSVHAQSGRVGKLPAEATLHSSENTLPHMHLKSEKQRLQSSHWKVRKIGEKKDGNGIPSIS